MRVFNIISWFSDAKPRLFLQAALCHYVDQGDEFRVQTLLERGANPNVTHNDEPLLHQVINFLEESRLEVFLQHGVDVNDVNSCGESSLHLAVQLEDKTLLQRLVKNGGNPWILNAYGQSPLNYAATFVEWNTDSLKYLLKNFVFNINQQDVDGNTILHNMYRTQKMGTLSCDALYNCLLHGANFETKNNEEQYPECFCTCALAGRNVSLCPIQHFLHKILKLNYPNSIYVDNFKSINLDFEMIDCDLNPNFPDELTTCKSISIKGRFLKGNFEKKTV